MYKHEMVRFVQLDDIERLEQAGWVKKQPKQEQAQEEIIRLKPPVKNKSTVKDLQEANIDKGDE